MDNRENENIPNTSNVGTNSNLSNSGVNYQNIDQSNNVSQTINNNTQTMRSPINQNQMYNANVQMNKTLVNTNSQMNLNVPNMNPNINNQINQNALNGNQNISSQMSQPPVNNSNINNNVISPQYEQATQQFQEVHVAKPVARTDSFFDGGLLELIGWRILVFLLTVFTLGIGRPWGKCMIYSYQFKHTVYNGKRLKFEGTGGDLFVNYFKWIFLSIITLGIYIFFIPVRKTKWVISNLHFEDEALVSNESYFDGKTIQLIGINILCTLLNTISLGLLYAFTVCFKLKWINKHTVINRKKLSFNGHAINLFGKYILWIFLTVITFGIYGLWLRIKMLKWQSKNVHIKLVGEAEQKDNSFLVAIPIAILAIILLVSFVPSIIHKIENTSGFEWNIKMINPITAVNKTKNIDTIKRDSYIDNSAQSNEARKVYHIG